MVTLHHVEHVQAVLRSFYALLTPGGSLYVSDLDQEDGSFNGTRVEVHKGFNRRTLEHALVIIGFINFRYETASTMHREEDGQDKEFPVFLSGAEKVK